MPYLPATKIKKLFLIIVIFITFICNNSYAQNQITDSKNTVLKKDIRTANSNNKKLKRDIKFKRISRNSILIPPNYLLEASLLQNCDKMTNSECFRKDSFFSNPYFHKTTIFIFNNKIVAEQFFDNQNSDINKIFIKIVDGSYALNTNNGNKISFNVKNGIVENLILVSGKIAKEKLITSKCILAEKTYGFYNAYNNSDYFKKTISFKDDNNFTGLHEAIIFSEQTEQSEIVQSELMAIFKKGNKVPFSIEKINICKKANDQIYRVRKFSKKECNKKYQDLLIKDLSDKKSENISSQDLKEVVEKNLNQPTKAGINSNQSIVTDIGNIENIKNGQSKTESDLVNNSDLQSIKDVITNQQQDLKNIYKLSKEQEEDLIQCSRFESCEDFLEINGCEVKVFENFFKN